MTGFSPEDFGPDDSATRIIYDMPAAKYHGDQDGPRLSQSLATLACLESPMHAYQAHPLLGGKPFGESWSFEPSEDDGTLIHSLVLEPNSNTIQEIDPSTIKTKDGKISKLPFATEEGKLLRAEALANGRIPILTEKLSVFRYKAKAIRSRLEDSGTEFTGDSEVVIYWTEETTFGPVRCRARIDHLIICADRIKIIDIKTCDSAHPKQCMNTAWKLGYDIQRASYVRAVEKAFPDMAGRVDFVLAFGELSKPYAVNALELDGEFARIGEARWERGRDRWAKGLREDHWTGYAGGQLPAPPWAKAEEMAVK